MTTTTGRRVPSPRPRQIDPAHMFGVIDQWQARISSPPPCAEPGSSLAGDARKSPELQVGHAAWNGIVHAVTQLHAFKALLVDAKVLHTTPPLTLLRASIENAATAVWLVSPSNRNERLRRCLKLAHHEAWEHGTVDKLDLPDQSELPKPQRSAAQRITEIRTLAASLGLNVDDICGRFSYEAVVRDAGPKVYFEKDLAVLVWKIFSGMTHGRYWATLGFFDLEVREQPGGHLGVQVSNDLNRAILVAQLPFVLTERALALFDRRRQPPRL